MNSKIVKSLLNDTCAETGLRIARGDECLLDVITRKVYHKKSQRYTAFKKAVKASASPLKGIKSLILF